MMECRRPIRNETDRLMLVFVEMEGWDCWLRPGESAELRAEIDASTDDYELTDNPEGITAWPSRGMGIISVWQGDRQLECGHQRPIGWI